jgi:CrcB protein
MQTLWVGIFGIAGVLSRYVIDTSLPKLGASFPWTTFLINILGCFLAAAIWVMGAERGMFSTELRTALLVGFAGGFTTFSAYSLQAFQLLEQGQTGVFATYLLVSPIAGLLATLAGARVAQLLF